MYDELKNIEVALFPNATHDLLRSFLECSLIVFFKNKNEFDQIQKNSNHNPSLGDMLTFIINGKSKVITDQNIILATKQIKTDYDKPYSLERLNMINHNENWVSSEREVRSAWGKLESLFKLNLG
jgi:DNA-directed RNA polymerase beta subunit